MTDELKTRLLRALVGAGIGGGIGKYKKGKKGGMIGALLGAAAGGLSPELINNLIRKPAGRVATNLVRPWGYEKDDFAYLKNKSLKDMAKAVYEDKPIYDFKGLGVPIKQEGVVDAVSPKELALRDFPYRKMFGLEPRNLEGVKDIDKAFTQNPNGTYWFNPAHAQGKESLQALTEEIARRNAHPNGWTIGKGGGWHSLLGTFMPKMQNGKATNSITDRWDVDLNSDEKINSTSNLARWLVSQITNPVTFSNQPSQ